MNNQAYMHFFSLPRKRLNVLIHLIAWTVVFLVPVFLSDFNLHNDAFYLITFYTHAITYISLFYVSYIILVPSLFFKKKKILFIVILLSYITAMFLLIQVTFSVIRPQKDNKSFEAAIDKVFTEYNIPRPSKKMHTVNYFLTSLLISGLSLGLRYSEKYVENEKRRKELEREHLNSELAMLKNQISPHFFFNTLNNIYSLIEINTYDAQKSILKLSKLMRYLLYESEQGETTLAHEIDFLTNYIDLMKLRITNKVDLKAQFPIETEKTILPPLLFVSFVENAFKHGISNRESSFIHISMHIENNTVFFECKNSIYELHDDKIENTSGIGLENIRKRLSLLFPDKHTLTITNDDKTFDVKLELNLPATA